MDVVKTVVLALIVSAVGVLGLSLLLGFISLDENILIGINQAFKVVSLLVGCLLGFKEKKNGFIKGLLSGLLFGVCSWLLFGLTSSSLEFSLTTLTDIGLAGAMGCIAGIIAVNLGKKQ